MTGSCGGVQITILSGIGDAGVVGAKKTIFGVRLEMSLLYLAVFTSFSTFDFR